MNSLIVSLGIVVGKIAVSLMAAFAVTYFRFPFRRAAFWLIFVSLMLPIEVRIVPGVSSALAVPALAGIPLTHRTANQGFTVITGHVPPGDPRSMLDYRALARSRTALVIMMGVANLAAIAAELIAGGMDPQTPAATVADGTLPGQRSLRAPLAEIAAATAAAGIRAPAITVVGSVAAFEPDPDT
jgi:uroporphyrin-III C-methyltransferase